MKRATIKNLNEYIRKTYPELDIELWKCGGIFPFSGPSQGEDDLYIESIYVNALSQAPYQRWCRCDIKKSVVQMGRRFFAARFDLDLP